MTDHDEAGYTLVEAMVAGTLTLILALPVLGLLHKSARVADTLQTRFALNAQARQVFSLLGNGTAQLAGNTCPSTTACSARSFPMVEGLRSRQTAPAGSTLRSTSPTDQFVFADGTLSVGGDAVGSTTASVSVTCTAAQIPVPDCTQAGQVATIGGWLGTVPSITNPTSRTAAVDFAMASPFRAARAKGCPQVPVSTTLAVNPAAIVEGCATEQYRSIYTLNVEAAP